ncbi:Polyketide cyclase / dehydrase and lipid transport [Thermomonospora echinospora]|uniref:Polyketide cyclase / dehydrase and lipid transport n=1 Tax=Thermomonospora echinospora TaxID=1992 RepID=A0A1H6E0I6_9ACTN|nr:SRPBCC family protein [Thermomonospora echinospora]SEG90889.1 Polyketide cyclase / dehydrase and lipid transport [Thermomonospora echinospora]
MEREWVAEESVLVAAEPARVYAAVADLRRMGEWSPECFGVWVRGGRVEPGTGFVGFNRIRWRVWFTTGRVTAAVPGAAFAFRVSSFGMPVALWGYRLEDVGDGSTRLTEYWEDLRRDHRGAALVSLLGKVFTGVAAEERAELNRRGMRTTLGRIKAALEGP